MPFKGLNFGGWLMMEGYILGGRNIPESQFKKVFADVNGKKGLAEFEEAFRDNFIQESDFANVAQMGLQVVRLPFHYKIPIKYLERACAFAQTYNLKVILDLHAAPGAQNYDWHSDSNGKALLWENQANQEKVFLLWEKLAARFKDESAVLGYDLLNEPVLYGDNASKTLLAFYKKLIKRIRAVDKTKILYMEGNIWAQQIDFLSELIGENIHISVHSYEPFDYTLNVTPGLKFPGTTPSGFWDEASLKKHLEKYYAFAEQNKTHIFVGEFGVNWRGGTCGEEKWLKTMIDCFKDLNFSWTYWTYKAIGGYMFPDGLYRHNGNGSYVKRTENIKGFETYIPAWRREKNQIIEFWQTKNFTPVEPLAKILSCK